MKGHRSIFQSLFNDDAPTMDEAPATERRGRSELLKQQQNELIVCRYYFYVKIEGRQYDAVLEILMAEVFLSKRTIVDIINRHPLLKTLHQSKPDRKYFRVKYPFLNWQALYQ